jgi:hypothetical protein
MDTVLIFAPVQVANDSGEPMTEAWYEDLQGGWGDSIGDAA